MAALKDLSQQFFFIFNLAMAEFFFFYYLGAFQAPQYGFTLQSNTCLS